MSLFSLIPTPFRIYAILGAVGVVLVALGVVAYKIDRAGYNRCDNQYKAAALVEGEEARAKIIPLEAKYGKLKARVAKEPGLNDPVGPRINAALDGLRETGNRSE